MDINIKSPRIEIKKGRSNDRIYGVKKGHIYLLIEVESSDDIDNLEKLIIEQNKNARDVQIKIR